MLHHIHHSLQKRITEATWKLLLAKKLSAPDRNTPKLGSHIQTCVEVAQIACKQHSPAAAST